MTKLGERLDPLIRPRRDPDPPLPVESGPKTFEGPVKFLNRVDGPWEGIAARAYNDASISVANTTWVALTFNSERFDTDGIHSTATNTGRLTCRTKGIYAISGTFDFAANGTGQRRTHIRLNGSTYIAGDTCEGNASLSAILNPSTQYSLGVGDYVELMAYQNSGGALNVSNSGANYFSPEFMMAKVA